MKASRAESLLEAAAARELIVFVIEMITTLYQYEIADSESGAG